MTSPGKENIEENPYQELLDRIEKAKHKHRVEQTHLPFPEKVRIVVELQKIDNAQKLREENPKRFGRYEPVGNPINPLTGLFDPLADFD